MDIVQNDSISDNKIRLYSIDAHKTKPSSIKINCNNIPVERINEQDNYLIVESPNVTRYNDFNAWMTFFNRRFICGKKLLSNIPLQIDTNPDSPFEEVKKNEYLGYILI